MVCDKLRGDVMKKTIFISAFILSCIFITVDLFARITVVSTTGEVAFRDEQTARWMPLAPRAELREGVRISTGINSNVTLNVSGNTVVVGPLSMMKIYQNQVVDGAQQTRVGMRRGDLAADVTRGQQVRTIFEVSTPVATSSVRGTEKRITTGPSGTLVRVSEGTVRVDSRNGQARTLRGRLAFNLPKGAIEPRPILTSSTSSLANHGSTEKELQAAELFAGDSPQGSGIINAIDGATGTSARIDIGIGFRPRQ